MRFNVFVPLLFIEKMNQKQQQVFLQTNNKINGENKIEYQR